VVFENSNVRLFLPVPRSGEDFDIDRAARIGGGLVNGGDDFLDVLGNRSRFTLADFAIEIPEVGALWQRLLALALEVFSHVALDLLDDPRWLVAWRGEWESFFHQILCISRISSEAEGLRRFFKQRQQILVFLAILF
jgi:hypothetical protein